MAIENEQFEMIMNATGNPSRNSVLDDILYYIYHNYQNNENYEDIAGYCKASTIEEIKKNTYVLTPGRYVGTEEQEDDGIPFEEKMKTLTSELKVQFEESHKLEEEIKKNLEAIGYGI